jgi:uncharacterized membrane protein
MAETGQLPVSQTTPVSSTETEQSERKWIAPALIVVAIFVAVIARWLGTHNHRPPVGVYIAIMGAVAAVMVFHEKPNKSEKVSWLILLTVLVVTEIRNVYVTDREQSDTANGHSQSDDSAEPERR